MGPCSTISRRKRVAKAGFGEVRTGARGRNLQTPAVPCPTASAIGRTRKGNLTTFDAFPAIAHRRAIDYPRLPGGVDAFRTDYRCATRVSAIEQSILSFAQNATNRGSSWYFTMNGSDNSWVSPESLIA